MSQASVARTLLAAAMLAAFSTRAVAQTGASHWVSLGPEGGTVLVLTNGAGVFVLSSELEKRAPVNRVGGRCSPRVVRRP